MSFTGHTNAHRDTEISSRGECSKRPVQQDRSPNLTPCFPRDSAPRTTPKTGPVTPRRGNTPFEQPPRRVKHRLVVQGRRGFGARSVHGIREGERREKRQACEREADKAPRTPVADFFNWPLFIVLLLVMGPWSGMGLSVAQLLPALPGDKRSGFDPTGRFGELPPVEKKKPLPPKAPPKLILPPVDSLQELQQAPPRLRVMVRHIQVEGSTVFSPEELANVTTPFENRELSTQDLEELRRALTLLYVNNGYVNSGAIIPDQTMQDGVITIQIIEGKLTDIKIEGTKYFLPFYFEKRIALSAGPPLNIGPLKDKLQILLQDSRIQRLNTELKPGLKPGEGVLHVKVEEALPLQAWVEFNNYQSTTIGEERGIGNVAVQNPFGLGDTFRLTYGRSEGLKNLFETNYQIPLTARDTTLELGYRLNDFEVVTSPFDRLNIESKTRIFKIAIRQPIYRTSSDEVALSLVGERLKNQNFIDGTGFSRLGSGTTSKGKSIVSALRFLQEWTHRTASQVLALRSRFSVGLDVLNATDNQQRSTDPDGEFWARSVFLPESE